MNLSALTTIAPNHSLTSRIGAFVELTKPRISLLVLFSVAAAGFAAAGNSTSIWLVLATVVGTGLVAASATIANQLLEIEIDSRMLRTAGRPLPSGRVSVSEASLLMIVTGIVGAIFLAIAVDPVSASLGVLTWLLYVLVYTPFKRRSSWNTAIGAIPGAMPVLIGWAATKTPMDSRCLCLFLILFLWQFPHFMAIAWMYRNDYRQGGLKMLTVTDPSGRSAGWLAVSMAVALILVTLLPLSQSGLADAASWAYLLIAGGLGLWQLRFAADFLRFRNDHSARQLLRASLIYLPLMLSFFTLLTR